LAVPGVGLVAVRARAEEVGVLVGHRARVREAPGLGRGLERWASLLPGGKAARMSVSHCLERSLGEGLGVRVNEP